MAVYQPWRGCHRVSEGCLHCYIHKGDARRGVDTNCIVRNEKEPAPLAKKKDGSYKMAGGQLVYLCFSSDFLLPEADGWRAECWRVIRERADLRFLFLTKRIERFMDCVPNDWGAGYENVLVSCTVENQDRADFRLPIFQSLPIRHKLLACQPLLESLDLRPYLKDIELVVVGGESDREARPLNYDWVLSIREQCRAQQVDFNFRQCGTHFIKDGRLYTLRTRDLCAQARKANIDLHFR